jgi:hypothetical protein
MDGISNGVGFKYAIDSEVKVFTVLVVLSLVKFTSSCGAWLSLESIGADVCRSIFLGVHGCFVFLYLHSRTAINVGTKLSGTGKVTATNGVKTTFQGLAARAMIVFIVHIWSGITPPLLVSSVLGVMNVSEDEYSRAELRKLFFFL